MKSYKQLIEGVYDPNIFKAFFLAGGPGSGKSFVVRRATGGLGLKIVNSDTAFEKKLLKVLATVKSSDMMLPSSIKVIASCDFTLSVKAGFTVFQKDLLSFIEDGFRF